MQSKLKYKIIQKTALIVLLGLTTPSPAGAGEVENVTFESQTLHQRYSYTLYKPQISSGAKLPLLILLHGAGDNEWSWVRDGKVDKAANRLIAEGRIRPFMIAMPASGSCWWQDGGSCMIETVLHNEIETQLNQRSDVLPGAENRVIAGNSAGGFAAIREALLHPEKFAAVAALSPAIYENGPPAGSKALKSPAFLNAQGQFDIERWRSKNYTTTLQKYQIGTRHIPILLESGDKDEFQIALETAIFHRKLLDFQKSKVQLRITDGHHSWDFWSEAISDVLVFADRVFHQEDPNLRTNGGKLQARQHTRQKTTGAMNNRTTKR